jgi:hypothetical protein
VGKHLQYVDFMSTRILIDGGTRQMTRQLMVVMALAVGMLSAPTALDAQALQASDIAAIEEAAVEYVVKNGKLPQGEIGFDRQIFGTPGKTAVERDTPRNAALARTLGAKSVTQADVLKCPGDPSTCDLAVAALVKLGAVTPSADGARVLVQVTRKTIYPDSPISRTTREFQLSRQNGKWVVVRAIVRSMT